MNISRIKYGFLFALFTGFFSRAGAMDSPPTVLRACLDNISAVVTVYFSPTTDACASFVSYELWGRDDALAPFAKLSSSSTVSATQIQATLPNKKVWELYIIALYACNGSDTLYSNKVFIDNKPPVSIQPDSVSIDLATQQMVAGWTKAAEPDVKGYTLFWVNQSGNNTIIDAVNTTFYTFDQLTFDPTQANNKFSMDVFDSCDNGSTISAPHSPVFLSFNTGQNIDYLCTKKIYIQWTAYIGWNADQYDIYVKDDVGNTWNLSGSVAETQLNYIFNIPALGRKYSFYVRSHKAGSSVTSTSNVIVFDAVDFVKPSFRDIGHVSVVTDGEIEITASWESTSSVSFVQLQRRDYGNNTWSILNTVNTPVSKVTYRDKNKNTHLQKYQYRIVLYNSCNQAFDSSVVHTSILLRRNYLNVFWNDYWAWQGSNYATDLGEREKQSSTWNDLFLTPDSTYTLVDTLTANCYRVKSILFDVNLKPKDTAYSNVICIRVKDTTLVPGGFSPGGQNPIFKIYNPNLEAGQASLKVYNRWGQKVFEGDALRGWDGKEADGTFILAGIYAYLIEVRTPEKIEVLKGTLMALR